MADPHHADHDDYQRGTMEISEQVATWKLVQVLFSWGSLGVAVLLLMATIWFCTPAGFFAGLIAGLVLFAAGFLFLRSGGSH